MLPTDMRADLDLLEGEHLFSIAVIQLRCRLRRGRIAAPSGAPWHRDGNFEEPPLMPLGGVCWAAGHQVPPGSPAVGDRCSEMMCGWLPTRSRPSRAST